MDPITGSIISGGAGLIGGIMQNDANRSIANDQMRFQYGMSSNAHQREVNDLRAAGLNPMLSALGAGSPVTQGASAQMGNPLEGISSGINTGMALKQQKEQIKQMGLQNDKIEMDTYNTRMQSQAASAQAAYTNQQTAIAIAQRRLLDQTMPSLIKKAKAEGDWAQVERMMGIIKAGTSSAADIIPTTRILKGAGELVKGKK